eukprot:CAMPEP_0172440134 /NCGR_PEP_ID=MMETSP1065-20121228/880_1 /TAXON_ID=265537 /ORGANISM="Amphiprora paludosa, Strain CCMP125" /LENGTH=603 /DNA_ID=CAMNT_0013188917 /DNA_START=161 /DNA_END=1972 /DNA_ORIENTATION=-
MNETCNETTMEVDTVAMAQTEPTTISPGDVPNNSTRMKIDSDNSIHRKRKALDEDEASSSLEGNTRTKRARVVSMNKIEALLPLDEAEQMSCFLEEKAAPGTLPPVDGNDYHVGSSPTSSVVDNVEVVPPTLSPPLVPMPTRALSSTRTTLQQQQQQRKQHRVSFLAEEVRSPSPVATSSDEEAPPTRRKTTTKVEAPTATPRTETTTSTPIKATTAVPTRSTENAWVTCSALMRVLYQALLQVVVIVNLIHMSQDATVDTWNLLVMGEWSSVAFQIQKLCHLEQLALFLLAYQLDVVWGIFLARHDATLAAANSLPTHQNRPHLIFPGGGIYFYWQAGVVTYLRESGYDLGQVTLAGASAGSLIATMTATGVDFNEATQYALDMVTTRGLWDRPGGLYGIWGPMVLEWLQALLPENAVELAHQHDLTLVLTDMPSFRKQRVESFTSREDLIACNRASIHIPWFMDRNGTTEFRGQRCIDGYIPPLVGPLRSKEAAASNANSDTTTRKKAASQNTIVIDWAKDPAFRFATPLHTVFLLSPKGIWSLLEQGKCYAKSMEEQGIFDSIPKLKYGARSTSVRATATSKMASANSQEAPNATIVTCG